MIKILHILANPRAEGTPHLVLDWLHTGLHEQEVFVLDRHPPELSLSLQSTAQWYQEADLGLLDGWKSFFRLMKAVERICRERKPDLVICWVHGLSPWICLGAWLSGCRRMLVHAGNPPTRSFKHDWLSRYVNWPLWSIKAKVVCCSKYVCDALRGVPLLPGRLFEVVYNCSRVDLIQSRSHASRCLRAKTDPTAIMVATLEKHKDHVTLLRAVPLVLQKFPRFKLLLAGNGSLRQQLKMLSREMGLADAVSFLGSRKDVPELLGQSDLFVFSTTDQEGLGSVLIEAMAASLPIVASDVPACCEVLEKGRLGRLVPHKNSQALAEAMIEILTHSLEDEGLSMRVKAALAQYTPQLMLQQYLSIAGFGSEDVR